MENDPKSPTLETSTITMEKDLEDAVNCSLSDNESFVITEEPELDSSSKGRGSSTPDIERLSLSGYSEMTQSKYAQIVFLEVADRYPNDSDIICKFTYNCDVPMTAMTSDRIGLYRVPDLASHEYLAFQWVSDSIGGKDNSTPFNVHFKASDLPKDEDFYQFQFLRTSDGSESAIGASIPFQLQSPKNEELICTACTDPLSSGDDSEFMVVRSRTSLVTEQMGSLSATNCNLQEKLCEMENKHKRLLDFSEKLQSELEKKSEAYLSIEEEKSQDRSKVDQLKADLACVLQDKCLLEERLHRHQKALQTLQMDRDLLTGERNQSDREKKLLLEERVQLLAKNDEFKDMMNAATKAKDLAVAEVRKMILNSDEQQKVVKGLEDRLNKCEALNRDYMEINNEQKDVIANMSTELGETRAKLAEVEFEKNAVIQELEELKVKLQRKENEFEVLTQEMFERTKTKFREIDALKKQLTEAERSMKKIEPEVAVGSNATTDLVETDDNTDDSLYGKVVEIERTVKETQAEMQQFIHHQSKGNSPSDLDSFEISQSTSMATDDSRRLLDDNVIHSQLVTTLNEPDNGNEINFKAMASPIKKGFNQVMNGFKEIDQPIYTGARAKTSQATPVEEPIMARSQSSLFQLIPQLSQSVFGSLRPDQKLFGQAAQEDNTNANPSAPIEEQPRSQDHDEFSELVNWAKGSISSSSTTSTTTSQDGKVVLTDDGRTMTEEEAKPTCPICSETFQIGQIKALELHVDSHLTSNLYCPVCNASFEVAKREDYQNHVQEHFASEDSQPTEPQSDGSPWSFMDFD